jgi:putative membrane protein
MPAVNAACNAFAASSLLIGLVAIRRKAVRVHRVCMIAAFMWSAVFLVGYLTYHFVHGDTAFAGRGAIRVAYLSILATHVVLSATVVPLALTAFYFAFKGEFERHRRLTRVFWPIWMYVSVTGVLVFFLLRSSRL